MSNIFASLHKYQATDPIDKVLEFNIQWAKQLNESNPELFATNEKGQAPPIFWISCIDSRYGDYSIDLFPGEILAHRSVANVVPNTDPSSQAAIQLAMQVGGCSHIVVCGHYRCVGVQTVLTNHRVGGALEAWLRDLRDVRAKYAKELDAIDNVHDREDRLAELHVIEQVYNVRSNEIVRDHIKSRGVQVHGLICDVSTGLIKNLHVPEDPLLNNYIVG